jgi:hypothetical protein
LIVFLYAEKVTEAEKKKRLAEERQIDFNCIIEVNKYNQKYFYNLELKTPASKKIIDNIIWSENIKIRSKKIKELEEKFVYFMFVKAARVSSNEAANFIISELKSQTFKPVLFENFHYTLTENSLLKYYDWLVPEFLNNNMIDNMIVALEYLVDELIINKVIY